MTTPESLDAAGTGGGVAGRTQVELYARDLSRTFAAERVRAGELAHANELLERLDRMKSSFLAFVHHGLRSPLTALSGVDLLDPQGAPAEQAEVVAILRSGHDRLCAFVERGVECIHWAGVEHVEVGSPVDLAGVVLRACAQLPDLAVGGIELRVRAREGPLVVGGVEAHLARLVSIVLENAVKFSREDRTISVELARDAQLVRLTVTDRGVGLDPRTLGDLFEPFVASDLSRLSTGTGLSLPIAASIARAHGGEIRAQPGPGGVGARFAIELPIHARDQGFPSGIPVAGERTGAAAGFAPQADDSTPTKGPMRHRGPAETGRGDDDWSSQ